MTEFIEKYESNARTQKDIEWIVCKNSKQPYKYQSQIGQLALVQRRFFGEAIEVTGEAIGELDTETGLKNSKAKFLPDKVGSSIDAFNEK